MKTKINILIITVVLTMIVFGVSTYLQKKMINYEATVSCLILARDINENEMVKEQDFRMAHIPISVVAMQKIVTNFEEIEGLYAKDNIRTGQIAIKSQFDTRENLSVYEAEEGKEKLSIKIKSPENGMSYQIKEKAHVNIYATLRNEYANGFLMHRERMMIGDELEGYSIIKVLEDVEVLGVFTIDGVEINQENKDNVDSILIAVTPEEAKEINLMRELAVFNITGINPKTENKLNVIEISGETIDEVFLSGDEIVK